MYFTSPVELANNKV